MGYIIVFGIILALIMAAGAIALSFVCVMIDIGLLVFLTNEINRPDPMTAGRWFVNGVALLALISITWLLVAWWW